MENQRFKEGEKVYWNAGWNSNRKFDKQEAVGWMIRGPYDFGYYSGIKGTVILYEEGCRNMQDSFAVSEDYIIKEEEYEEIKK